MTRRLAPPKPATEAFKNVYHELDRETLAQQGAEHLRGKADVQARRVGHWLRLIVGGIIGGAIVVGGGFCAWLLHTANNSGQNFAAVREQAFRSYAEDAPTADEAPAPALTTTSPPP